MTISRMRLVAAALAVTIAAPACGQGSEATDDAARAAEEARAAAADSMKAVHALERKVDGLSDRLGEARSDEASLAKRLDGVAERLWGSLAKLRTSVDGASSSASSALSAAQGAARDLAVLTQRLDYHLRESGG